MQRASGGFSSMTSPSCSTACWTRAIGPMASTPPPSDAAVEHELHTVRELGFNLLRKHAKIEPERWYYHCDKLGIIVWQDMVNGGGAYPMWVRHLPDQRLTALDAPCPGREATVGLSGPGQRPQPGGVRPGAGRHGSRAGAAPLHRVLGAVSTRGWGQFDARKATETLRALDPVPSGGRGQRLVRPGRGRCAFHPQLLLSAPHPPEHAHSGPQRVRRHCMAHARP